MLLRPRQTPKLRPPIRNFGGTNNSTNDSTHYCSAHGTTHGDITAHNRCGIGGTSGGPSSDTDGATDTTSRTGCHTARQTRSTRGQIG